MLNLKVDRWSSSITMDKEEEEESSKVNVIVRLEFELAYFEVTVQHFSPYATETRPNE